MQRSIILLLVLVSYSLAQTETPSYRAKFFDDEECTNLIAEGQMVVAGDGCFPHGCAKVGGDYWSILTCDTPYADISGFASLSFYYGEGECNATTLEERFLFNRTVQGGCFGSGDYYSFSLDNQCETSAEVTVTRFNDANCTVLAIEFTGKNDVLCNADNVSVDCAIPVVIDTPIETPSTVVTPTSVPKSVPSTPNDSTPSSQVVLSFTLILAALAM